MHGPINQCEHIQNPSLQSCDMKCRKLILCLQQERHFLSKRNLLKLILLACIKIDLHYQFMANYVTIPNNCTVTIHYNVFSMSANI